MFYGYYRGPSGNFHFFSLLSQSGMDSYLLATEPLHICTFIRKDKTLNPGLKDRKYYNTLHALLLTANGNQQKKSNRTDKFQHFSSLWLKQVSNQRLYFASAIVYVVLCVFMGVLGQFWRRQPKEKWLIVIRPVPRIGVQFIWTSPVSIVLR